jgi:hypothetical protein
MDKAFKIINPDWSRFWTVTHEVDDATMVDPDDATRVLQGEWVELAADSKVVRTTTPNVIHFPMVDIPGQFDVQATSSISLLRFGNFEVDTSVYDTATLTTLGQAVEIDVIAFAPGPNNRGIPTLWSGALPALLVGYVTKAPASGRIRFQTVCF